MVVSKADKVNTYQELWASESGKFNSCQAGSLSSLFYNIHTLHKRPHVLITLSLTVVEISTGARHVHPTISKLIVVRKPGYKTRHIRSVQDGENHRVLI